MLYYVKTTHSYCARPRGTTSAHCGWFYCCASCSMPLHPCTDKHTCVALNTSYICIRWVLLCVSHSSLLGSCWIPSAGRCLVGESSRCPVSGSLPQIVSYFSFYICLCCLLLLLFLFICFFKFYFYSFPLHFIRSLLQRFFLALYPNFARASLPLQRMLFSFSFCYFFAWNTFTCRNFLNILLTSLPDYTTAYSILLSLFPQLLAVLSSPLYNICFRLSKFHNFSCNIVASSPNICYIVVVVALKSAISVSIPRLWVLPFVYIKKPLSLVHQCVCMPCSRLLLSSIYGR